MVYISRLIEEAYEEFYGKMILLSFNGEYVEDYFVIGIFDKKHLALAHALKQLKQMKAHHKEIGDCGIWKVDKNRRRLKWYHDFYQQFEFKEIKLNQEIGNEENI